MKRLFLALNIVLLLTLCTIFTMSCEDTPVGLGDEDKDEVTPENVSFLILPSLI